MSKNPIQTKTDVISLFAVSIVNLQIRFLAWKFLHLRLSTLYKCTFWTPDV